MQVNLQTCPPVVAIKSPHVNRKSQPVSIGNSIPCSLVSLYPTSHAFRCQIKTIYVTNRFRRKHLTKQAAGLAGGGGLWPYIDSSEELPFSGDCNIFSFRTCDKAISVDSRQLVKKGKKKTHRLEFNA